MMDGSHLWYKICIYERLEFLNERQFCQIVDFIKEELNRSVQVRIPDNFGNHITSESNKQFIKAFLFKKNDHDARISTDSLTDLWQYVVSLSMNRNCNYNEKRKKSSKIAASSSIRTHNTTAKITSFPLLKLPADLITHTCLFFCEKTMIESERCCRCLYQTMNNSSFIRKSNNFKKLSMHRDNKKISMKYISNHRLDFFKFSQLTELVIIDDDHSDTQTFRNQFKKILNESWFISGLKSLKRLWLGKIGGSFLLDLFPFSQVSKLDYFKLHFCRDQAWQFFPDYNHNHNNHDEKEEEDEEKNLSISIERFDLFYTDIYFVDPNLWILKDDNSKYVNKLMQSFDITHLELSELRMDIEYFENVATYHPHLRTLSLGFRGRIFGIDKMEKKRQTNVNRLPLNISTLRMTNIADEIEMDNRSIIANEQALQFLNLDKSVKNLTLGFKIHFSDRFEMPTWNQLISNVLKKYCFCNLVNLNILISDWYENKEFHNQSFFCKDFFNILLTNKECIKNQFKQFNIGYKNKNLSSNYNNKEYNTACYTFTWNDKITNDEILLHQDMLTKAATYFTNENKDQLVQIDFISHKNKYDKMEKQWVDQVDMQWD